VVEVIVIAVDAIVLNSIVTKDNIDDTARAGAIVAVA
jgi:hypothetical protein